METSRDYHEPRQHHGLPPSARVRVAAAVVWRDGKLLFTQRPPGGSLGLKWEFPGGKIEPGETPEHALTRELREELGVEAKPIGVLAVDTYDYPHGPEVEIHFVRCELQSFEFLPAPAVFDLRWQRPAEVKLEEVLAGDRAFLASLGAPR